MVAGLALLGAAVLVVVIAGVPPRLKRLGAVAEVLLGVAVLGVAVAGSFAPPNKFGAAVLGGEVVVGFGAPNKLGAGVAVLAAGFDAPNRLDAAGPAGVSVIFGVPNKLVLAGAVEVAEDCEAGVLAAGVLFPKLKDGFGVSDVDAEAGVAPRPENILDPAAGFVPNKLPPVFPAPPENNELVLPDVEVGVDVVGFAPKREPPVAGAEPKRFDPAGFVVLGPAGGGPAGVVEFKVNPPAGLAGVVVPLLLFNPPNRLGPDDGLWKPPNTPPLGAGVESWFPA